MNLDKALRHKGGFQPAELIDRFVLENRKYAFICMDAQGTIAGWLGAAEEIFGFTAGEMIGRPIAELFVAEDRERGFVEHELEIARKVGHSEDDRWHLRKDGTRIWLVGACHAVRDDAGDVTGFVKVTRDRTDLRSWTEKLENQAGELNAARERTLSFLRTLGHEMRNPLAPLSNAARIIERLHDDEKTRKALQIIDMQLRTLQRLAQELMHAAQLDAGKVKLQLEASDLRSSIKVAVAALRQAAEDKGLHLEAILPSGPLMARLDEERFQQVLLNLITNSIKYTPPGGAVWIKPTQEGNEIALRIEDTGIGIDPEVLPRIFDLFSRQPEAEGMDPGGLGIGLAVVREVVHLHHGSVQARSGGAGKGSEFTVRLPAAEPHSIEG